MYTNSITINIGHFLSKKLNCPHIWHVRESMSQFSFKFSIGDILARKQLKNGADTYILISDYLVKSYDKFLPLNKVKKIYNGIKNSNVIRESNFINGYFNIGVVGVLSEQKNQMDALKATKNLIQNGINNVRLHIVGGANKNYLERLKVFIETNHLSEFIILYGHQTDVNKILSNMNIGLMCSHDEAFGRVTVEYMLNRMPVIASKSGANEELVKCGINGDLYELYDSEELSQKIEKYYRNQALLETVGNSAREFAIKNFSSEKYVQNIYDEISKLIS